jgi:hypothetical protein
VSNARNASRTRITAFVASIATGIALLGVAAPASATVWPGGSTVSVADDVNVFNTDLSGLAYQPSGSSAPGVLWAVDNGNSLLQRLIYDGTKWTPDPANGWATAPGKVLHYANGNGLPDSEGVALADDDPTGIYVSSERDGTNNNVSRLSVLRYDVTAAGADLTATDDWDLTPDLPVVDKNLGLEAITWIPDSVLVAKGFRDEAQAAPYNPVVYPNHGTGLFFVGLEANGLIYAYALDQTGGTFHKVATIASGFPKVMELTFEPQTNLLWAICDNDCNGQTATLDVGSGGAFGITAVYDRPAGMGNFNNEGFAIAPEAECVNGVKPVFWADDDNDGQHALRSGTLNCAAQPTTPPDEPTPTPTPTPTPDTKVDGVVTADKTQEQKGRKIAVEATVNAGETLTVDVSGKVKVGKDSYSLRPLTRTATAASSLTLKLKPAKKDAGKIADALVDGDKAKAKLTVSLSDAAGNQATQPLKVKLTQ